MLTLLLPLMAAAQTPARERAPEWEAWLDSIERGLADHATDPARLIDLSDALRRRRDAAMAAGPGTLSVAVVRRSAHLIARLETARTRAEMSRSVRRRAPVGGLDIMVHGGRYDSPERPSAIPPPTDPGRSEVFVFVWPLDRIQITSGFGRRADPFVADRWAFHAGLDLAAEQGTSVHAAGPGRVRFAGVRRDGCGRAIVINHPDGFESEYCHLSTIDVERGERVSAGQRLGGVGSTGRSTGDHLHWTVRRGGHAIDPRDVVGRRSDALSRTH